MIYELLGHVVGNPADVRHREYARDGNGRTRSRIGAFSTLPDMLDEDGALVCFSAKPLMGARQEERKMASATARVRAMVEEQEPVSRPPSKATLVEAAARRLAELEPNICAWLSKNREEATPPPGIEDHQPIDGARYLARIALGIPPE